MGIISVEFLEPGMELSDDVRDSDGMVLLGAGAIISERHIGIFKSWGGTQVEIKRSVMNVEAFFLGGMLHDIGRVVLILKMPEKSREIFEKCSDSNQELHVVEKEVFGCDHTEVGAKLMKKWGLPAQLEEAVECHHLPQKSVSNPMLASMVHIAHALKLGNRGVDVISKLAPFAWSRFGMAATILPGGSNSWMFNTRRC